MAHVPIPAIGLPGWAHRPRPGLVKGFPREPVEHLGVGVAIDEESGFDVEHNDSLGGMLDDGPVAFFALPNGFLDSFQCLDILSSGFGRETGN